MLVTPPVCDFGWKAKSFTLQGTDKKLYKLEECLGDKGTLIVFMCNHCPYVLAILDRLLEDARALTKVGINTIAINSNDPQTYPEDSFENMVKMAASKNFPFPYLFDATQEVARAYDAQCTPDFFGFNTSLELQYRGRLDSAHKGEAQAGTRRELVDAMKQIAETGQGPDQQVASMGCSIKWQKQKEQ